MEKWSGIVSTESYSVQTVVIGSGVVGLAIGCELARSGREVLVLEAGSRFGEGISSRNSEVIHAGIYYPDNSLKAALCVRGRQLLYDYCISRNVEHRKCGKWIIATDPAQVDRLAGIQQQAGRNGVHLQWVDRNAVSLQIPGVNASAGLWSSETGIVDSHGLMLSLLGELQDEGGQLVLNSPVIQAETVTSGHILTVGGEPGVVLRAREVVNAAGLGAPALAGRWSGLPDFARPEQWLARGVYFSYSGNHPFTNLIYPLPEPGGLGVHLTLDLAGQARFGPDVEWITEEDYTVDSGRADAFADSIGNWWPGLDRSRLIPAYAGIRPKLAGPGGGFFDFRIDGPAQHRLAGLVNLFGIESPGLTSCLALAEQVRLVLDAA
ncbi:MAG: putative dehydrogenase [Marinobacter excellens HL-55]|uniref:Putative dehydrogenase n=1 Tax=Marinobacter excellens HL-55 TaxID=1305731 RepID=A0A0P7YE80_9GAMM|nr:MAG: putative dehydrogenase [Marinobacter excellens HL-55]